MNSLQIILTAAFVVVTIILCVVCSRSPKEKGRERLIVYQQDGYEIEPAQVPQFEPTWPNDGSENLSATKLKHKNPKGGLRA